MVKDELPFQSTKIKAKSLTYLHNRESPFSNKICHRSNVDRAFRIHKGKLDKIKNDSKSQYSYTQTSHKFLDESITKTYKQNEARNRIMEENFKLLKVRELVSRAEERKGTTNSPLQKKTQAKDPFPSYYNHPSLPSNFCSAEII